MVKKTLFFLFLSLVFFSFAVSVSAGGEGCPLEGQGLVPCGNVPTCPCELCDLFVMINRIIKMLLLQIIPVLAALMIAIGGIMLATSYAWGGSAQTLEKAKGIFTSVVIGLVIIYCAWAIVNLFLAGIGVSKWEGLKNWWVINCSTSQPPADNDYGKFNGGQDGEFNGSGGSGTW